MSVSIGVGALLSTWVGVSLGNIFTAGGFEVSHFPAFSGFCLMQFRVNWDLLLMYIATAAVNNNTTLPLQALSAVMQVKRSLLRPSVVAAWPPYIQLYAYSTKISLRSLSRQARGCKCNKNNTIA